MKFCPSCKITKSKSLFSVSSGRADGLQSQCKACRSERRKADYIKNKSVEGSKQKVWASNNQDKVKEKAKRYRQSPKGSAYYNHKTAIRRANKNVATPTWLTDIQLEQIKSFYEHAKECEMLTGDKYHVDHIIPLNGESVSGLHVPWNLQVLPADINISKSNNY